MVQAFNTNLTFNAMTHLHSLLTATDRAILKILLSRFFEIFLRYYAWIHENRESIADIQKD